MRKTSLKAEEALAPAVEKYPCLYNNADPGYKEKDRQQNAWVKIENNLGLLYRQKLLREGKVEGRKCCKKIVTNFTTFSSATI